MSLIASEGWHYKSRQEFYLTRDRSLVALLYLGDFRISEVLPIIKKQFTPKETHIHLEAVRVGKRKRIEYREARLPLEGERTCFTQLILAYLDLLKENERLYPWSLEVKTFDTKQTYKIKDGTVKPILSVRKVGTHRAWQIVNALLPNYTQHWLRAFGYNYDYYKVMDKDIFAVSDKTKADPRSVEPYLRGARRRDEKYPIR